MRTYEIVIMYGGNRATFRVDAARVKKMPDSWQFLDAGNRIVAVVNPDALILWRENAEKES